jgi:phage-related holin
MDKKDFWPKEGKLKKGLIILAIVIVSALLITLLEEKTNIKTKKITFVIAFACIGVWVYKPADKKENAKP